MKHISALVALLMLAASAMADDDGVPRRTTASDNTGLSCKSSRLPSLSSLNLPSLVSLTPFGVWT